MCLLVTQTKKSPILSNQWLEDFYNQNSDGVGVMYVKAGELVINKVLPKTADDFIHFYHSHIAGKNCAFHLRMKTHGLIDLDNCHPYEVLNKSEHGLDVWLMHNGILSTGNLKDVSRSDTWHYIQDYLKPMLANNPDFAFTAEFSDLVGSHIGSTNKFVLMDNLGRQTVINRSSGVYWAGLWLSNTYAWSSSSSASKTPIKDAKKALQQSREEIPKPIYKPYKYGGYFNRYDDVYDDFGVNTKNSFNSSPDFSYDDDEELDIYFEVEMLLDDLQYNDIKVSVTLDDCVDFIIAYGLEEFQNNVYLLIQGDIDVYTFEKSINNSYIYKKPLMYREANNES